MNPSPSERPGRTAGLTRAETQAQLQQVSRQLDSSREQLEARLSALTGQLEQAGSQRLAELAAKEQLALRLQGVLDSLPGALVVMDVRGRVQETNAAARELLGLPLAGELWRSVIERCFVAPGRTGTALRLHDGRRLQIATRPLRGDAGQLVVLDELAALPGTSAWSAPLVADARSRQLLALAERVAQSDCSVLIGGESGTGKEVLARFIHQHSARVAGPFVAVNCAAIPENMLEALLFGYEKGAFTGAVNASPGKFEQANGGTLLLDEISEMPLALQAKLLRVLQEREVERLGARRALALDIRVLATSNRDLPQAVAQGQFRGDLYYRLAVFPLAWPALRERRDDILPLVEGLLQRYVKKMARPLPRLSAAAGAALRAYHWPGNVRELDNAVQRALVLQTGPCLELEDFCLDGLPELPPALPGLPALASEALRDDLRGHEFQLIRDTLAAVEGNRQAAAERLGISPRTLRYKLAKMKQAGDLQ